MRRNFVRTKAPPLPGLTCWNSTIFQIFPSISMWLPLRNWLVETVIESDSSDRAESGQSLREAVFGTKVDAPPPPRTRRVRLGASIRRLAARAYLRGT